jgi:hypothetical protein
MARSSVGERRVANTISTQSSKVWSKREASRRRFNSLSAVAAPMAMAKIQGLIIDQQIVGAPQEFESLQGDAAEQQLVVIERLRERISERYGSAVANRATARFANMIEDLRSGKLLDGEADDDAAKPH